MSFTAAAITLGGLAATVAAAGTVGSSYVGVAHAGGGPDRGLAPRFNVHREMSATAMRRTAHNTRPDLHVTARTPVREVGTHLARLPGIPGRGDEAGGMYASLEDVTLVCAGPRKGKTGGLIAPAIVDHPGAVFTTTTRVDTYELTAPHRTGPLSVFNLGGTGAIETNIAWDLTIGCEDPDGAEARAGYMIGDAGNLGVTDGKFWDGAASSWLRCALFGARVDGRPMAHVASWARDLANPALLRILQNEENNAPAGWADEVEELIDAPEKTRKTIGLTLRPALAFMSDPAAAAAVTPARGRGAFDVERFIDESGTCYLIGRDRANSTTSPLFSAFAGHIVDEGRRIAAERGGRLELPMLGALDEITNVAKGIPLADWTSDCGGHGIPLLIAVQSLARLDDTFGAEQVLSNATTAVFFGGSPIAHRLEDLATLVGKKVERLNEKHHRVPVMEPSDIFALPRGEVLILRGGVGATRGTVSYFWDRKTEPVREAGTRREPTGPIATITRLADRRRAGSAA